jgi:hypothetical protein
MNELTTADFVETGKERQQRSQEEQNFSGSQGGAGAAPDPAATPLFAANEADQLRSRWNDIQASFVDEPRRAVEQADGLVAEAMKRLAEVFAEERRRLEEQWDKDGDVSTEELRVALQRYRSFFGRLLSV